MTERATFSLEDENFEFLNTIGGTNKSAYINDLLRIEKQKTLINSLLQANKEEANDIEYQEQLSAWDLTLHDGFKK